jgi:hypothetical protein
MPCLLLCASCPHCVPVSMCMCVCLLCCAREISLRNWYQTTEEKHEGCNFGCIFRSNASQTQWPLLLLVHQGEQDGERGRENVRKYVCKS